VQRSGWFVKRLSGGQIARVFTANAKAKLALYYVAQNEAGMAIAEATPILPGNSPQQTALPIL
jgi:hypothetical protein